jgi:hypothetical protein
VLDLSQSTWLADLVDAEIAAYDPSAARLKLPPELRSGDPDAPSAEARARALLVRAVRPRPLDLTEHPLDAFQRPLREHVALLLDIALVFERPQDPARRRGELAALLAALTGASDDAIAADPAQAHRRSASAVRRAFAIAAGALIERGWPPGDPRGGLPLRAGLVAIERRQLGRLAIDYHRRGGLEAAPVRRRLSQARHETTVLFEALASAAAASGPIDRDALRSAVGQLRRLELPRPLRKRARAALGAPFGPEALATAVHPRFRPFVLEQLLLAAIAAGASPARSAFAERFAASAGIPAEEASALGAEAALLYASEQRWLESSSPADVVLSGDWQDGAEQVVEKVAAAFAENLEALVTELKETGELGHLLAKAAAGHTLTDDERLKVKAQLVDVAKAVPALAIFAAPGGMLLLPLLAKVLPFKVLPSAWNGSGRTPLPPAPGAAPTPTPLPTDPSARRTGSER